MHRRPILFVAVLILITGCTSGPTSPVPPPPLPESIEIVSMSAPAGTTFEHSYCVFNWDFASCFQGLQFTVTVRSNRDARFARLFTEFRTSDGRVCAETLMDTSQPIVAGVVATFRTGDVYLKAHCFDLLPFQTVSVLARVTATSPGEIVELMKQEFSISYTFAREETSR